MLRASMVFLMAALAMGLVGFAGIAETRTGAAQILFFVFLILSVASLVLGVINRNVRV